MHFFKLSKNTYAIIFIMKYLCDFFNYQEILIQFVVKSHSISQLPILSVIIMPLFPKSLLLKLISLK